MELVIAFVLGMIVGAIALLVVTALLMAGQTDNLSAAPTPERMASIDSKPIKLHDDGTIVEDIHVAGMGHVPSVHIADIVQRNRAASLSYDTDSPLTADQMLGMDIRDSIAMDVAMHLPIDPVAYGIAIADLPESIPYDDPLIGTILQAYREGIADGCELYLDAKGLTRCKVHGNRAACPKPNLDT